MPYRSVAQPGQSAAFGAQKSKVRILLLRPFMNIITEREVKIVAEQAGPESVCANMLSRGRELKARGEEPLYLVSRELFIATSEEELEEREASWGIK